ncbi:MAG: class I SAM-dependent methyltransferase [bacterium]
MKPTLTQDEEQVTAHEYDQWLARDSLSARWVRFWFSPKRTLWLNTQIPKLPAAISLKPGDSILDIGCGYGGLLIYLHRRLAATAGRLQLEGVDSSPLMVQRARDEIQQRGLESAIRIEQGVATQLPYEDHSFDVILCAYVIKHLSDESLRHMLREVKRVLKPGGRFCLWEATPSRFGFMNVWNLMLLRIGISVIHLRSAEDVGRILEEEGWVIQQPFGHGLYYFYPPLPRAGFIVRRKA